MKLRLLLSIGVLLPWIVTSAARAAEADGRDEMLKSIDARKARFSDLSRQIWEHAELGYKETKSSKLLKAELRDAGFTIQDNIADIPTAFIASFGRGKPVIAILGEYDALPGLSQETVPQKKPRAEGAPGHGCGHNLFGTGSALAAVAVKLYIEQRKLPGTLRFYGCPAEEGGAGKVYMARAGAFDDCDVALTWHPHHRNAASVRGTLANMAAKFRFRGEAAHASAWPSKGRSALDAAMLMCHAVELLREHMPDGTRLHYVISNGGAAPNVVPDFAEVYLYARHPEMQTLDGIWERVVKCAQAGALASDTKMEMELVSSVYHKLPNESLAKLMDRNLRRVGGVAYTPEEQEFAEALHKTLLAAEGELPLGSENEVQPILTGPGVGSSDVADVSWIVPTSEIHAACFVPGTPLHSWQSTACAGMSIGHKGMIVAAKTLALTAVDLLENPAEVRAARESFDKTRAGKDYRSRLPADQKPPLNYRDKTNQ